MLELHWTFAWTLAVSGLAWLVVSFLFALALGRVLGRTNRAAEREQEALAQTEALRAESRAEANALHLSTIVVSAVLTDKTPLRLENEEYDEQADADASRASSGTRFKPVRIEGEHEERDPKRHVS